MSKRTTRSTGKASPLMVHFDAESKRALAATAELWRISVSNYVRTVTVAQAHREVSSAREQIPPGQSGTPLISRPLPSP